jgi:hypothetical protein
MINFLQSEYLNGASSLVHVFKNGNRRVYKKHVKERHPFIKDDLAKFVVDHPEVLEFYKNIKGAQGALENRDFDKNFDAVLFADSLVEALRQIPSGGKDATKYHSFIMGALTFIFYPDLIRPIKEKEVHQGRKRIDILYTNAAIDGFFFQMQTVPQTRSLFVPVECKNYRDDIGNPELDQLAQRFGHQRGFFGILACREVSDIETAVQRCRDTANDGRGFILIFTDDKIIEMLRHVGGGNRAALNDMLRKAFADISH